MAAAHYRMSTAFSVSFLLLTILTILIGVMGIACAAWIIITASLHNEQHIGTQVLFLTFITHGIIVLAFGTFGACGKSCLQTISLPYAVMGSLLMAVEVAAVVAYFVMAHLNSLPDPSTLLWRDLGVDFVQNVFKCCLFEEKIHYLAPDERIPTSCFNFTASRQNIEGDIVLRGIEFWLRTCKGQLDLWLVQLLYPILGAVGAALLISQAVTVAMGFYAYFRNIRAEKTFEGHPRPRPPQFKTPRVVSEVRGTGNSHASKMTSVRSMKRTQPLTQRSLRAQNRVSPVFYYY